MAEKIVLFGAGFYGKVAVHHISAAQIEYVVDNDINKAGTMICNIPVYFFEDKKEELKNKRIVISVSKENTGAIYDQLQSCGIKNVITYFDYEQSLIKNRLNQANENIHLYKKAVDWIYSHTVPKKGIINNTWQPYPYPEVTGYYIPSLLNWGHRDLAIQYANWLCEIQKEDGSWCNTEDTAPFVFDTAQILKGLIAIRDIIPEIDSRIIRGCNWIVSRMEDSGRLPAVDPDTWGDETTLSELIHLYCVSPLYDAGRIYNTEKYIKAADKIKQYYISNFRDKILDFNLLSHFYAYVIEGLIDIGEMDLAKEAMRNIETLQKDSGFVSAYKNVNWICSTGLFQLAGIWFRLEDFDRGERAFNYMCSLQNESGGWYGGYPASDGEYEAPTYFSDSEISWANKYFLDALKYRNLLLFENEHRDGFFIDSIDKKSSAYNELKKAISNEVERKENSGFKVLDVGCGKGGHLRNLAEDFNNINLFAIDITALSLDKLDIPKLEKKVGGLTNIPYKDDFFDVVYTCEALEHAIDIESAVKELSRVTRRGGIIIIIDKYLESGNKYLIERWEQFFDEYELKNELEKYCSEVSIVHGIGHDETLRTMSAWIGRKN